MSTQTPIQIDEIDYPTGDGEPVAETPIHRDNLVETIWMLQRWYEEQGRDHVYVSGNMFVYYEKGNRRRHLAPDVFVVDGVPNALRDCYKTWEELKPTLDLVIEFTSRSTKEEDLEDKFELYRDELGVREYLLFDPYCEYLVPAQKLFRLKSGDYEPVEPVDGRLPSEVLGLHFERDGMRLRLWVPATQSWLPFPKEDFDEHKLLRRKYDDLRHDHLDLLAREKRRDAEIETLRAELESLKRKVSGTDGNGGE